MLDENVWSLQTPTVDRRLSGPVYVLDTSATRPLPSPGATPVRRIEGSVKLNLFHKNNTLTVMVMHVRDLVSTFVVFQQLQFCSSS